jgi:membrane protease YdiL (CAAX protease family)
MYDNAIAAVAVTVAAYAAYHLLSNAPVVTRIRSSAVQVVVQRSIGLVVLGLPVLLAARFVLHVDLSALGVGNAFPLDSWLWIGAFSLAALLPSFIVFTKPATYAVYPRMRLAVWGVEGILTNAASCAAYTLGYEFLFRGFLLFACVSDMPALPAIAINTALYSLAHSRQGTREVLGAMPVGVLLCVATIETGAIWAAVITHIIISQATDYVAVWSNPDMRFTLRRRLA